MGSAKLHGRSVGDAMPSNQELEVLEWVQTLAPDPMRQRDSISHILTDEEMGEVDRDECLDGLKLLEMEETGGSDE